MYKIVTHYDEQTFMDKVKKELDRGWKPQGGVSVSITENEIIFCQALTLG
jgi:hypothetical protein